MTEISRAQFLTFMGGALGAGLLAACTGEQKHDDAKPTSAPPSKAPAIPVEIRVPDAPKALTIGIVASLTSGPGEGSEWLGGVGGARVATQRLAMGGTAVSLVVANDTGTGAKLKAAIEQLATEGAAGIVLATSGPHLEEGLEAARKLGIATLMPYARDAQLARPGTWLTGALGKDLDRALKEALTTRKLTRPLLLDAGGGKPAEIEPVATVQVPADADAAALTKLAEPVIADKARTPDCLVLSGPTVTLATLVAAVQGAKLGLPVFLTAPATAPGFGPALTGAKGSMASDLTTVGPDAGDDVAMRPGPDGAAMSAYLSGIRMTAGDPKAKDIFSGREFVEVAADADVLVHDAVVALVLGAGKARSAEPKTIATALAQVKAGASEGLAGGPLDFTKAAAYDATRVIPLAAAPQDLALRPRNAQQARVSWFKAPA